MSPKYLILLLVLSFGSASIHALVDHDFHGCDNCILTHSSKIQISFDDLDDANDHSDLAIFPTIDWIAVGFETVQLQIANQQKLFKPASNQQSIRAPPFTFI